MPDEKNSKNKIKTSGNKMKKNKKENHGKNGEERKMK